VEATANREFVMRSAVTSMLEARLLAELTFEAGTELVDETLRGVDRLRRLADRLSEFMCYLTLAQGYLESDQSAKLADYTKSLLEACDDVQVELEAGELDRASSGLERTSEILADFSRFGGSVAISLRSVPSAA
jgi:hypothetical protein